jgi:ComF family protein
MLQHLFTETCLGCAQPTHGGLCRVCIAELPRMRHACARCGLAQPVAQCPRKVAAWHVDAVVAPFAYRPPLDHYVHALKYRGVRALGRALGLAIVPELGAACGGVDAIVAVPLHRARLRERGYNQAVEIARTLARELELPLLQRGIERHAAGRSQTGQSASQRRASVALAFAVRRNLAAQRIAIVDDVLTTGATINALAAALRTAGAVRCVAWAVARTPPEG